MHKVVSLFSGCGGLDLGFKGGFTHLGTEYESLPFEIVWANDNDSCVVETYKANENYLGNHAVVEKDIRKVKTEDIPECDVILAGFPCQPFSNAGKRNGVNDERGTLFEEVERIIKDKKPLAFIIENVKGILSSKMADGTSVPQEIRKRLSKFEHDGETVEYYLPEAKLLKSNNFGVPQQRQRVFIIGLRKELVGFKGFNFKDLYNHIKPPSLNKLTVADALENISKDLPNFNDVWDLSPQAQYMVSMIDRSWKDIPYEKLPDRFKRIRDNMKKYRSPNFYRRFGLDEINGTIIASAQPENCGIVHPIKDRRYTVREIARIQSFPDQFIFPETSISNMYKAIGNAVPPVLGHVIGNTLKSYLDVGLGKVEERNVDYQVA